MFRSILIVLFAFLPIVSSAECVSEYDNIPPNSMLEIRGFGYSICYESGYDRDANLARHWVENVFDFGMKKYGITSMRREGKPYHITLFLPIEPTNRARRGSTSAGCCYTRGDTIHAEISYLSPSSPDWTYFSGVTAWPTGNDYHGHYITHEMIHAIHWAVVDQLPIDWIAEGIAEYDGYMHTTLYNRGQATKDLLEYPRRKQKIRDSIYCCFSLDYDEVIGTTEPYWGGSLIMVFLAERFGEDIHRELLHHSIGEVIRRYGVDMTDLFKELREWVDTVNWRRY